ncbi:hypothetical protein AB0B89_18340 [Sphaerisporangium sp. NPDC049002]|uniref:hypothetical protein n=1 Tax=Sphaerisporangium sp. NPDC049002 TaxID=3155392 RepID=UPI0033CB6DBC
MNAKTPAAAASTSRPGAPGKGEKPAEKAAQEAQATTPQPGAKKVPATVEPRPCLCGCGEQITSKKGLFRPGHDARMVGQLTRAVVAGEMTEAQALERLVPASELLKAKVTRSIKLNVEKAAKKAQEAAAKAEAKKASSPASENVTP